MKDSNFSTSTGDEAGTAGGGVASNKTKGKAEFVNVSFDVQFEGKGVARAFDLMLHNDKHPAVPRAPGSGDRALARRPKPRSASPRRGAAAR